MKINFINPSRYLMNGRLLKSRRLFFRSLTFPLLAALTPRHIDIKITNEILEDINYNEKIDLVGITAYTTNAFRAYEIADEFRKRNVPVVMGGMHVSTEPEEAMEHCDTIFIGEADETWPRFLDDFQHGSEKRVYTPDRLIQMDNIPIPRFSLFKTSRTSKQNNKKIFSFPDISFFPIQTARGCPYSCDFCALSHFYGKKIRVRPIDSVIQEINAVGAKLFFIVDENIFAPPARARKLFQALRSLNIYWVGQGTISAAEDQELIQLAGESGCVGLCIGLESLSQESLKSTGKQKQKINVIADYGRNLKAYQKAGIAADVSIMFGFDGDKPTMFQETYDFLVKNNVPFAAWWPVTPFPGTRLYQKLKEEDRLKDQKWWLNKNHMSSFFELKFMAKHIDDRLFSHEFCRYYKRFYSLSNIARRFLFPPKKGSLIKILYSLALRKNLSAEISS